MNVLHLGFPNSAVYRAFARRHHRYEYIDTSTSAVILDEQVCALVEECDINVVFIQAHRECLSVNCLKDLLIKQVNVFHYIWDVFDPMPQFVLDWASYCTTFFTNKPDVQHFCKEGYDASFMPYGFDEGFFTPYGDTNDKWGKIVFMANNHEGRFPLSNLRIQIVERLRKEFPNDFKVYGHGWGGLLCDNLMYRQSREAEAYRSCDLAINVSSYDREGYTSDRLLRAMGSGACVLSKKIQDGHPFGVHGETHLEWDTVDSLVSAIKVYLKRPEDRKRIGAAAADLVHRSARFDEVVRHIEEAV